MTKVTGTVFARNADGSIGEQIEGAELTFRLSGNVVRQVRSEDNGTYAIELEQGRYVVTATRDGYEDFSTEPGFLVVTDDGPQTFNVFMKPTRRPPGDGPRITEFSPRSGYPGTKLTIHGLGFASVRPENEVTVGGEPAEVIEASPTELTVLVSNAAVTGPVTVTVAERTGRGPHEFEVRPYPEADAREDGPPIHYAGEGQPGGGAGGGSATAGGGAGVPTSGTLNVLVSLVRPSDLPPSNATAARNDVIDKWDDVGTFFDQASFGALDVQATVTNDWHELTGNETTYVDYKDDAETDDEWWESNVIPDVTDRLYAEAAAAAEDEGNDLDDFDAFVATLFLDGSFIRAWNSGEQSNFSYAEEGIDITTADPVNTMILQETADWGRCAHELAHGLVNAPENLEADGNQVLREDIYDSDLVDPSQGSAEDFDMMGSHDDHPLFSAFFMKQLGWYDASDPKHVRSLEWDRNPTSESFEIVAHGNASNGDSSRCHAVELKVTDGLSYFVEVRQRPGSTSQIFDDTIPLGGARNEGGVVVTKVLTDRVNMNQQMRFLTLLHEHEEVLEDGESAIDPARDLEIEVTTHAVETRPLVCEVSVEWAQELDPDPEGKFDLTIEPWDSDYQTPDIWVDRKPYGSYDKSTDAEGRPRGNGDKPKPEQINRFTARFENTGTETAEDVRAGFYSVEPPGVGDNGNWAPIKTVTVGDIAADSSTDEWVNWVPVVDKHTCLKVEIGEQLGEVSFGNNGAQENVFEFEAPAESIPRTVRMETAVRNPLDRETIVYLRARNVPRGYTVHFPHRWLWLDPREEQRHEFTVVPTEDYAWYLDVHQRNLTANITLEGMVPRHYTELVSPGTFPPSWLQPIGGVTTNVTPKRVVDLELDLERADPQRTVLAGVMTPAMAGESVSVEVRDPEGRERVARTRTDADGEFDVTVDLTGPAPDETDQEYDRRAEGPVREGTYRAQAYTIGAATAAETTSNVVHFDVRERGEVETDPRRRPSSDILRGLGTVRDSVSDVFSRFTGNDDTVRRRRREP